MSERTTLRQELDAEFTRKCQEAEMSYLGSDQTSLDYTRLQETLRTLREAYGKQTYVIYLDQKYSMKRLRPIEVEAESLLEAKKLAESLHPNTIMSMGWLQWPQASGSTK